MLRNVIETVIAGVNLNNLKANHNSYCIISDSLFTVIAGVNLNNLKANHNPAPATKWLFGLLSLA